MRRLDPKLILTVVLLTGALLVAGCGGDDDDQGAGSPPLSKEEYIAQGDAICTAGDEELVAEAEERFGSAEEAPPRAEQEAFISEIVAPGFEQQLEELRELSPPEEDQEQIDALLAALEELADAAANDPGAVIDGEFTEASRLAREYGFTACGS